MRLERRGPNDDAKYYLVKDIRVGPSTARIKKYLGAKAPTQRELKTYEKKFSLGLELKAASAAGRLGAAVYKTQYIAEDQVSALEEVRYLSKLISEIMSMELSILFNRLEISSLLKLLSLRLRKPAINI